MRPKGGTDHTSISGKRFARELSTLIRRRAAPGMIVSWTSEGKVEWNCIAPDKPMQNGFCESFNGRMRDELLNETLFYGLDHARQKTSVWVSDYNHPPSAFFPQLRVAGGICGQSHRNRRSAARP